MSTKQTIALVGNPNSGKTTLFNKLTGLRQKVGNFPGITVDKKVGSLVIDPENYDLIDLPGCYSLYPKSQDEEVVHKILSDKTHQNHPDLIVLVIDAHQMKRGLLLASQIVDLQIPAVIALNQTKANQKVLKGEEITSLLGLKVISLDARDQKAVNEFVATVKHEDFTTRAEPYVELASLNPEFFKIIENYEGASLYAKYHNFLLDLSNSGSGADGFDLMKKHQFNQTRFEATETTRRYAKIKDELPEEIPSNLEQSKTSKLDKVLTHKVYGILIFLGILFLMFQAVFAWASVPMDLIDEGFNNLAAYLDSALPESKLTDLLVSGLIPGLCGVLIFVPQIAFLFLFIAILEETGYMARVSFMMDGLLRRFGLNGKSVLPLISGVACAVPAIMTARTIGNRKERLITILVTPLMSCAARLPVYTLLIALLIPEESVWGVFQLQGLVLMAFYLLGFVAVLVMSMLFSFILKAKERSYFIMEMPSYKMPDWPSVGLSIVEKVKVFVFEAGKVILAISLLLWCFSVYGPKDRMEAINEKYEQVDPLTDQQASAKASEKLENSYIGILGKTIEPAIAPLGFDWKIGIALISSFAAREVFVGAMGTIYAVQDPESGTSLRDQLAREKNPITGNPRYTLALGLSLMLFYAFAMQCMSTLAISVRETGGWKWPAIQFLYMGVLAYLSSLIAYQCLA